MLRIMLVEDELLERQAIRTIIENAGLEAEVVAEADNGPDALELVKKEDPDLVFVDIRIPGMNGLDFIEQTAELEVDPQFIIVSAYDYFGFAKKAMSLGVKEYLLKPVRKEDIIKILEDAIGEQEKDRGTKGKESFSQAISTAIEFMEENYARDISLADVAGAIPLNPFYFSRQFKNETGMNFSEHLMRVRMDKAKEMLKDSDMTITEIAVAVGYKDPNYFSTVFRKTEGISPRNYRQGK